MTDYAPCPTCGQYSHSIDEDQLADAFNHFQSMRSHRGDGLPTQYTFDEATRDAAQVLMAAARTKSGAGGLRPDNGCDLTSGNAPASGTDEAIFRVGNLTLTPGYNPGTTWIVQSGGEGGEFPTDKIEALLQAYYTEHF